MVGYKVAFHIGGDIGLKTRADKGRAEFDGSKLVVTGSFSNAELPVAAIVKIDLIRLYGLGTVIKVAHDDGTLFVSVIRFMIGQFAIINYFATRKLCKVLMQASNPDQPI